MEEKKISGAFIDSLKRNNKQIRNDRAESLYEDTELIYKRIIEDLQLEIKKKQRERENMLDLSPANATNLVLGKDFNAEEFVTKDVGLAIDIRNLNIKVEEAKKRYNYLFGDK